MKPNPPTFQPKLGGHPTTVSSQEGAFSPGVSTARIRSLQLVSTIGLPTARRTKPLTGRSQEHVIERRPLGPGGSFGTLVVSQQASAEVSLSAAHGKLKVDMDPASGDVSIGGHGFRMTDPGVLRNLASNLAKSGEAGQLVISGETAYTVTAIHPPFHATIGGVSQRITDVKINVESELNLEHAAIPSGNLKVTAEMGIESPQRQKTSLDYSIDTSFRYEPPSKRRGLTLSSTEIETIVLAGLLGGAVVIRATLIRLADE